MDNKTMIQTIAQACSNKKAEEMIALDMQDVSLMTDYFFICHGDNERQVQAIARAIKDLAEESEIEVKRMEGFDQARWILIDMEDIVCHIFHKDERYYYNLERLWGDAPKLDLQVEQKG